MEKDNFEVIARAVIVDKTEGKVLFCATKSKSHYFLPGGHIDFGESAPVALAREIREEMGISVNPIQFAFAGASENIYKNEEGKHHEINLFFQTGSALFKMNGAQTLEDHILFEWVSVEELDQFPILPKSLPSLVKKWATTNDVVWKNIE